jgi:L-lactate dehydrogenase complex protein LldE
LPDVKRVRCRYGGGVPVAQLFVTCLVDGFAPEVGRATVRLLERLGVEVSFPQAQACCGQPAMNSGHARDAARMARQTVRVLDATIGHIVVPSGSCADMLTHHAPHLLEGGPDHAAAVRVASRVRELTQYLVDELGVTDVGASCAGCSAVFHPSCHGLRNLGIDHQPTELLAQVDGLERRSQTEADQCCGFGGLFSVEMPDISAAILATKLDALEATGADIVVGGDLSCLLHIEGGLRRRGSTMAVRHIAEVLADGT